MFSSLDNSNGYNMFDPFNLNQTTMSATDPSFENPNFKHPSSPFLPYCEAFLDSGINESFMSQLMFQQQGSLGSSCNYNIQYSSSSAANNNTSVPTRKGTKKETSRNNSDLKRKKKSVGGSVGGGGGGETAKPVVSRRRTGKKDRHSKIFTAQGPRDRRMRLSLQVARKFFDLQDMLGFDKASKTIEWLFSKSKASIKELKESMAASSGGGDDGKQKSETEMDHDTLLKGFAKRRAAKDLENPTSTKESRDKARERARERTMMKKMRSSSKGIEIQGTCFDRQETNSNDLDQFGSSGTSQETILEDLGSCSQETRTPVEIAAEAEAEAEEDQDQEQEQEFSKVYMQQHHEQVHSVSLIEKFLGIRRDSNSASIFGYSSNIGDSTGVHSEESFTDLSGNWSNRINDGADHHHQYSNGYGRTMRGNLKGTSITTGNINVQVQNPNASILASLDHQNPNLSFPMTNPSSSVSIYDYLSY